MCILWFNLTSLRLRIWTWLLDFSVLPNIWNYTFALSCTLQNECILSALWSISTDLHRDHLGYFHLLWCIRGLNSIMLEVTNDWEFLWNKNLWYCYLIIYAFFQPCFVTAAVLGLEKRPQSQNKRQKAPFALRDGISRACRDLCSLKGHDLILRPNTCHILIFCCLTFR